MSDHFAGVITKTEKAIFDSAVELIKKLDIDGGGFIRNTTANLKLLSDIKTRLARVANNKEYLRGVKEVAQAFDDIYRTQVAYYSNAFAQKTLGENHKSKYAAMQRVAVANTIDGLTGAGLQTGVLDQLNKMLLKAVTSGAKYSDLVADFRSQLVSSKDGQSAFARYAGTYATTAMTQYVGQNNKLFTDDLDAEWFEYVGSTIESTREFCNVIVEHHPYIHVSEIPNLLKGEVVSQKTGEVIHVALNPKTGLPKGMIEDTTPENFQINVGGWNCRHQLVPIAKEAVPEHIRRKFEQQKAIKENPYSGYSRFMREYGSRLQKLIQKANLVGMENEVVAITREPNAAFDEYVGAYDIAYKKINDAVERLRVPYVGLTNKIKDIMSEAINNRYEDIFNKASKLVLSHQWSNVATRAQYDTEMKELSEGYAQLKDMLDKANASKPPQTQLGATLTNLANRMIDYREVGELPEGTTEQQIIERLSGGDRTGGSCSSLAFAYAGNKAGLDVLDFRGGRSRDFFSYSGNIGEICKSVGGKIAMNYSDFDNAHELLGYVEIGKQYYFTCGRHAAIVRKTSTGYEFLELQSPYPERNTFKPLDDFVLRKRFKAQSSHSSYGTKYQIQEYLIDIDILKNDPEFRRMLGYINTAEGKQMKGSSGSIK